MDKLSLFHRIADSECARLRKWLVARDLTEFISFRNVESGEQARADWEAMGSPAVPVLVDEELVIKGLREITDHLLPLAFDTIAAEVWKDLETIIPEELQAQIKRVEFAIEDEAWPELLVGMDDDIVANPDAVCGLHVGVPRTEESLMNPDLFPTRVYLFRNAMLDLVDPNDADPEGALREEIAVTLLHEIGHYFGLEEEDLERLGYD